MKNNPITKKAKSSLFKDCPKCELKKTYGQLVSDEWYCWNCNHKSNI